ncbi:MAG: FecR domain-containing protein [Verrucomicrobiota bacterium]
MNKTLAWLCTAVLTLTLVSAANAESGKQRTGKVVRIKGDARYSTGNKIWQPLKVGTIINSGNVVQTAPNSFVDIVVNEEETASAVNIQPISTASAPASSGGGGGAGATATPDQDVIRVLDDTYLVFDSMTATATGADTVTETLLDLKKGSIFGSVKKQAAASRFEVKIPNGVAGIRGTIFLIKASGLIACLQGSVVAAYTSSSGEVNTQVVGGGQEFNCATGTGNAISTGTSSSMNSMAQDSNYASKMASKKGRRNSAPNVYSDHVSNSKP